MQNGTLIQFFDWYCPGNGQHWEHFRGEISRLLSMGITAAWLPPAYKGTKGAHSEGYDVYDLYDLGEFDQKGSVTTKYGTREQYIRAITEARNRGLKVYVDIVMNHMGGAEELERFKVKKVDPGDRTKFISDIREIEAYTKFLFPGRAGNHSSFQWNYQCFTGVDHIAGTDETGIFKILNDYGEDWKPVSDTEKGNFDYLILNDIETRNPHVKEELKNWIKWYYHTIPFDGVRLDAVKHMDPQFFVEWIDHVRSVINPELFVLGEYWLSDNLSVLLKYLDDVQNRMHLFDAPLHHNLSQASIHRQEYDLRTIFNETLVAARPELAVTFVDNHDTQPLQSLEEYTLQWFKPHAYAIILLRKEGYPCVFYPDIYGSCYTGRNKNNKETRIEIPALDCLPVLLNARQQYAYGPQEDYFDDPHCIGWTRLGDEMHPGVAVLLSNHPHHTNAKKMRLGTRWANREFYDMLGDMNYTIRTDAYGNGEFTVQHQNVAVWVPTHH